MVSDVATGAAFLEIAAGDMGKAQDIIQLSNGQESGVGGDGSTVKFQADFAVVLEPERTFSLLEEQRIPTSKAGIERLIRGMGRHGSVP